MKNFTHITFELQKLLFDVCKKLNIGVESNDQILIEKPAESSFGDYSSNMAMKFVKHQSISKTPLELASRIVSEIEKDLKNNDFLSNIKIAGNGFINFYLSDKYLKEVIYQLNSNNLNSFCQVSHKKNIIVEYSSPNIAKPFTIGHLRSTIIGDSIANLQEYIGHTVYRDNHLGDWGTQFGKQIYAIKTWGDEKEIDQLERPVKKLVELYVKFHEEAEKNPSIDEEGRKWFKKLEDGDPEAKRLWQKCIDWSWKEFNLIYKKLNVKFTENNGRGFGESFFEDKMGDVVNELENNNLLQSSQDARLVFFPEDKFPPMMIIKKDGATLYATRDLATDKFRLNKYGQNITIINEVGSEQSLYFQQLFEIEKMLGWISDNQRIHVKHGLYRFADKKMSTRKGNVIWLEDVLQEAFDRVKKVSSDKITEDDIWKVAIGAIKWNDLKSKAVLNTTFDWDEIIRIDGNSGPYLQYTYSRCRSVLEKASYIEDLRPAKNAITALNAEEKDIISQIILFPEIVLKSAQEYAPHHICNYLFELAQKFNVFYNKHSILQDSEMRQFRLEITSTVSVVIQDGLNILGIELPKRM